MHQRKSVRRFVVANSTLGSPRRFSRTALLSMAAAAVLPAVASATTYQWIGGTGNWGTAANTNWSPTGLPNSGDTANVTNTLGAVQTITYGYAGTAVSLTTLTLDADGGGGTGSETLSMAANNLSAAAEYIGYSNSGSGGKALFNQSGGTNNGTYAYLGVNSTDVGTYLMTGGAYNAPEEIFDGYVGGGVFNASGSANVSCGFINLGDGNGSTGSFSLTGNSSLDSNFGEFIGYFGAGTFNQAGASVNDDNASLYLATVASISSYQLSGSATLNVAGSEFVGDEATATFTQTGATQHTIAGTLSLASFSGATGTFVLSGGNVTAGEVDIGGLTTAAGRGVMTVNGGTLTTAGILTIYNSAGSGLTLSSGSITAASLNTSGNPSAVNWTGGALTLTAGGIEVDGSSSANLPSGQTIGPTQSLNVQGETIGGTGAGSMTQTGGVNNFGSGSQLIIGGSSSATGSYTLSGSGLLTGTYFDLAYFGSGTYNQSGGVATVTYLNTGYQGNGTATLSGGALNADAEFIGTFTNGTFNQSGGVNTISGNAGLTGLFISSTTGTATYNFSGGTALVENGPVVLGNTGPNGDEPGLGILNITGGTFNITGSNALVVNSFGATAATLNGGTLELGGLITNGFPSLFNWTGGTLSFNGSTTFDAGAGGTNPADAFGTSLTIGANQNLTVNGDETLGGTGTFALTLNSGSVHYVSGVLTITPAGTLTQNTGSSLYASEIIQSGGTINGALTNQGYFDYQGGAFNGRLINQGNVSLGPSFIAGNGIENDSSIYLESGESITVNGAGLDNLGYLSLTASTINGSGPVLNDYGGELTGSGTINPAFTNDGMLELNGVLRLNGGGTNYGVVQDTGTIIGSFANAGTYESGGEINGAFANLAGGILQPYASQLSIINPWTNSGQVNVEGFGNSIIGGTITNSATIQGSGDINSPVVNNGIIQPGLGELDLGGAGDTNSATGRIQLTSGNTVAFLQGLATNSGDIAMTGGTFDNNNHAITNASGAYISGWGSFSSGGLTNNGFMYIGGGFDAYGPVINGATGTINATGTGLNAFFGPVTNNSGGSFSVQAGASVTFFNSYTGTSPVNNSGTVTFAVASTSGPITGGGQTIVGDGNTTSLQLVANGGTSSQTALTINNGSTVDLTNNTFFVNYGAGHDPISAIASYLTTGYASDKWTGIGIVSSTVANLNATQSQLIYDVGYADGADGIVNGLTSGQIEIMPTLAGDAKLQGNVVFGDFQVLAQYFGKSGGWDEGNFTYGATIDFGDFQQLAQDFGATDSALTSGELASLNSFAAQFGDTLVGNSDGVGFQVVSVPEPASAVLMVAGFSLLARRRRTR